ncbi:MAG: 6-pyruvoyl-tetrahydropterin synthase-related protein [Terracidiphilus sp.]
MTGEFAADKRPAAAARPLGLYAILILAAGAAILALPLLLYGAYPQAHDFQEHLNFSRHFSEQFWAGEWYPRWLIGINHGLGSPTFFVFPPLQAFVYAILEPLSNALHLDAFLSVEVLVLFASGVCAFLWLQTHTGRRIAIAGAVFYMLVPYHLMVDFYMRNALPECWALAWIPLLLYFTSKIMGGKRAAVVSFAVVYALFILSHLISVLIFSPIPLIIAVTLPAKGQRLRSVRKVVEGILLGTGLSSFYLIPALSNARNFPPERLSPPPSQTLNLFLIGARSTFLASGFFRVMAIAAVDAIAVCAICGAAVLVSGRQDSKRIVLFWLAVCAVPSLMMFCLSAPVWRSIPILLAAVQYPFRLNIILCVAAVAIVTIFLSEAVRTTPFMSGIGPLILLVAVPWLFSYAMVWVNYRQQANPRTALAIHEKGPFDDDGWFHSWTPPGMDPASALRASMGSRVRFIGGVGTANVIAWMPRHIELETASSTGGQVMVNQFYYPAWQTALVPSAQPLVTRAAMPEGLIEVEVPPGQEHVRLDIPVEPGEYSGRAISAVCVLLCVFLAWRMKRDGRAGECSNTR